MSTEEDLLIPNNTITKSWVCEKLKPVFGEKPTISEVSELGADAQGYMSIIRRLHLQAHSDKVPKTVIVKIPNCAVATEAWKESSEAGKSMGSEYGEQIIQIMHRTEVNAYSAIQKYPKYNLRAPKVYHCEQIGTAHPIIIMEDLDNTTIVDIVEGFSEKQLYAITDEIVKLQVISFLEEGFEKSGFIEQDTLNCAKHFPLLVDGVAQQLHEALPDYFACIGTFREHFTKTNWYLDMYNAGKDYPLSVLVHGDLWGPQILWRGDQIAGIVDWALAHKSLLTEDLLRVLATCIPVERRHRLTTPLFDYYYKELSEQLEKHGKTIPFTRERLDEEIKKCLSYTAAMTIFAAGMWANSSVLKKGGPDDQQRIQEIFHRCRAIVEEANDAFGW